MPSFSQRTPSASSVRLAVTSGWVTGEKRTPHHMGALERSMARSPARMDMHTLVLNFMVRFPFCRVVREPVDGMDRALRFPGFLFSMDRNDLEYTGVRKNFSA